MTDAIRASIASLLYQNGEHLRPDAPEVSNAGLELSRYLKAQKGTRQPAPGQPPHPEREDLLARIHHARIPEGYRRAYDRWESFVKDLPGTTATARFRVEGRVVVGIGTESVLENAITVNRIWGMPLIPGAALKGLANHYMQQVLANGDGDDCGDNLRPAPPPEPASTQTPPLNAHGTLFGTTWDAAYINWLDAWYVPPPENRPNVLQHPFRRDVLTNHHQRYYAKRGANPPWDFDDPNPVPFISATGYFLVALHGPDRAWVDFAIKVLGAALEHFGVGAKTNAGYGHGKIGTPTFHPATHPESPTPPRSEGDTEGRDQPDPPLPDRDTTDRQVKPEPAPDPYQEFLTAFEKEIRTSRGTTRKDKVADWAEKWLRIRDESDRLAFARSIAGKWIRRDVRPVVDANPTALEIERLARGDAS